jgi:uncharacterized protein (UPF0218 family)
MTVAYIVTPKLRKKFKEPFGTLIQGSFPETMNKIKELVESEKPSTLISVGDVVSHNMHKYNVHPQITIVDNKFLRTQSMPKTALVEETVNVSNPKGTITEEAIFAIKDAIEKEGHTHIIVKGEEDLLTLIAVLYAPKNAYVIYGQPYSGIVVVKVTVEKKAEAQEFLNAMKPLEKLNKKKTV